MTKSLLPSTAEEKEEEKPLNELEKCMGAVLPLPNIEATHKEEICKRVIKPRSLQKYECIDFLVPPLSKILTKIELPKLMKADTSQEEPRAFESKAL